MTKSEPSSLVIVGVTQAGVGSLFDRLAQHPEVGPERYRGFESLAPLRGGGEGVDPRATFDIQFEQRDGVSYQLEASPSYFAGGEVMAGAVRERLPDPCVVLSLRDPVDRLLCAYRLAAADRRGPRSLDVFVNRVAEAAEGRRDRGSGNGDLRDLVRTSRYGDHLPAWVEVFGDRLRVMVYEMWSQDVAGALADLHEWLGLPPSPSEPDDGVEPGQLGTDEWYRASRRSTRAGARRRVVRKARRRPSSLSRLLWTGGESTASLEALRAAPQAATLRALFTESNRQLVEQLRALGHEDLPAWLPSEGSGPMTRAS